MDKRGIQMKKRNAFLRTSLPFLAVLIMLPLVFFGAEKTVAIKGGTVLTMAGKTIPNGIVLIKGEKIQAVGDDVRIPADAVVIDASGKYVMPGIIDAMTYYGVRPFDLNDPSNPVTPQNRIIQAYYPFGQFMRGKGGIEPDKEILSGGVTTVYIAPGDRQVIGGQGAVVKTCGPNFDRLILREPAAIDMAIGDPPKAAFGEAQKSPVTRMSIAALIRKSLVDAQEYDRGQKAYDAKSEEEKKKSPRPPRDLGNEALAKLLNREIPARIESDLPDDLRTAIRIAEEFNFNLVIDSGLTAYLLKDELAQKKIPVVLGPTSHPFVSGGEVSSTPELLRVMDERNAAYLAKAGVKIAIASFGFGFGGFGDAVQGKWLLLEAGLATGFDLPDEEALKAVTINPAQILGVADRVGSLEPGKDADILILDGYPLNVKTWVEKVFVNGEMVYLKK
jgi:imidazolonepropionase-like amidohydrolase